jgi:flagellar biosynthesis/type III secretory pathway M-ring protein FliF/YscJ
MTQPQPQLPPQSDNTSLIIGIVVGGVVLALIVIAGVIAFIVLRNRRESKENNHQYQSNDQDQSLQKVENQYATIPARQVYHDVDDVRDANTNT